MFLETYTRLLIDANPEFPIHFLNIYSVTWSGRLHFLCLANVVWYATPQADFLRDPVGSME